MKIEISTINRLQMAVQSYGICTDATSRTPCHRQPGCCPVPARALACRPFQALSVPLPVRPSALWSTCSPICPAGGASSRTDGSPGASASCSRTPCVSRPDLPKWWASTADWAAHPPPALPASMPQPRVREVRLCRIPSGAAHGVVRCNVFHVTHPCAERLQFAVLVEQACRHVILHAVRLESRYHRVAVPKHVKERVGLDGDLPVAFFYCIISGSECL